MQSAFDEDDPDGIGDSYLIGSCPCVTDNPTKIIHKKEQRDIEDCTFKIWKEVFYLTTHSTHFSYGYMASDIWLRKPAAAT